MAFRPGPYSKQCSPQLPTQSPLAIGRCRCLHCFSTGSYCWAHNLWVLIIFLFLLLVMFPSVVPRLATDSAVRVFPCVWKLLFFKTPFPGRISIPTSLSLFLSFVFFPTFFQRQWAAFLDAWCPLPAFKSCSVEFTQRSNVLLMNLWGRKWSPHPIPPPS